MKYGNVNPLFELSFNFKASGSGNVLKIYSAKAVGNKFDRSDNFICVFRLYTKWNASTPANSLKSAHFPSITGIPASPPISPRPRTAVPSVITATRFRTPGKLVRKLRILLDFKTRLGNPRRVGKTQ